MTVPSCTVDECCYSGGWRVLSGRLWRCARNQAVQPSDWPATSETHRPLSDDVHHSSSRGQPSLIQPDHLNVMNQICWATAVLMLFSHQTAASRASKPSTALGGHHGSPQGHITLHCGHTALCLIQAVFFLFLSSLVAPCILFHYCLSLYCRFPAFSSCISLSLARLQARFSFLFFSFLSTEHSPSCLIVVTSLPHVCFLSSPFFFG